MWSDNPSTVDFLNTDFITKTVQEIVNNSHLLPVSVGIYGPWGSGKSTILGFLERELQNESTLIVKCNLWTLQNYEDPTTALINSIMLKLESSYSNNSELNVIKDLARDLSKNKIFSLLLNVFTPTNIKDFIISSIEHLTEKKTIQSLTEFQIKLLAFLENNKIEKIIVLIDDLDRCTYNTIISTLESIKLFFFLPKMAFIMAMDRDIIQSALKEHFKNIENLKVNDYFEKLIQVPITLPSLSRTSMENYITSLFTKNDDISNIIREYNSKIVEQKNRNISILDTHKDHCEIKKIRQHVKELTALFIPLKYTTPRMCKRVLNNVALKKIYSSTLQLDVKDTILTKLTLFELTDNLLFKDYIFYVTSVKKPSLKDFYDTKKKEETKITKDWLSLNPNIFNVNNISDYLFIMQYFIEKERIFSDTNTKELFTNILEQDLDWTLLKKQLSNSSSLDFIEIWNYTKEDLINEDPPQTSKVIKNILKIMSIKKMDDKTAREIWIFIKEKKGVLLTKKYIDLVQLVNKVFKSYSFYCEYNEWELDSNIIGILNKG